MGYWYDEHDADGVIRRKLKLWKWTDKDMREVDGAGPSHWWHDPKRSNGIAGKWEKCENEEIKSTGNFLKHFLSLSLSTSEEHILVRNTDNASLKIYHTQRNYRK